MLTLCPNLTLLYPELPFLDRFAAAAAAGFKAVEFQFPYDYKANELRDRLNAHDLDLIMFNLPAGDWAAGDRGLGSIWARRDEFARGLETALEYADILHPKAMNLLAGISEEADENDLALLQNSRIAAEALAEEGLTLLVEPINTRDMPGFALPTAFAALDMIAELDQPNVMLQLDVYHAITMGEDPLDLLREHADQIGHIQIADVPGRHHPGSGSLDWIVLFKALTASGYQGAVGLEYFPEGDTDSGFSLLKQLGVMD
ncbi:MAG: TIM barrel protein [Thermomicrobiales bacterium]|nr:TIM barrel protein [Thermomicrobiales bacterium]MCO5218517.1 TIM barrel protein [Thermomicrobiales bacterium]MCO5224805.1 TIM barrel protein [Thermomicrobiales bacterium]MCO5227617.1 TIM barrel protein [Thermomicrobiales bacterium]